MACGQECLFTVARGHPAILHYDCPDHPDGEIVNIVTLAILRYGYTHERSTVSA